MKDIRSVSFDTSFLLKDDPDIKRVFKELERDGLESYVTSTVISELEHLKRWERINEQMYKMAMSRWKRVGGKVIAFKNRFLSNEFKNQCIESMGEHHGINPEDIINDCNIIVTSLKNGVDLFLSQDFHFTSKITLEVLEEVKNNACVEYHQMCGGEMYCLDAKTFLHAYKNGKLDLEIVESLLQNIRKPGKLLDTN
jgi:rRNA-processing protein FCF1